MKKLVLIIGLFFAVTSCIVSTATKVVTTAGKVAIGAVKATVNGIDWAITKANGKIDDSRLNGKWKVVGLFKGSFDEFSAQNNHNNYVNCIEGNELYEFKVKKEKFIHYNCGSTVPMEYKYKFSFEKNPETRTKENMITYGPSYFSVLDVTKKTLALEGYFVEENGTKVKSICLLEKVK